jgi:hypothetical protein
VRPIDQLYGISLGLLSQILTDISSSSLDVSGSGKRKNTAEHVCPEVVLKRGRKCYRLGKLELLLSMPLDILFEVCLHVVPVAMSQLITMLQTLSHLYPLDLLRMSHATKVFREILMSKLYCHIWIEARRNVPGLPDCPSDLSEPQYSHLLFVMRCDVRPGRSII